jgi:RimJ/RimL family protein N-acetyltransferase
MADDSPTIRLVPFTRLFLDRSWDWLHDHEIKRLTLAPDFTRDQQIAFFEALPDRVDYKIWGVTAEDEPIGAAGIKSIAATTGEFWCYIGERNWWGRGVGARILELCEREATALGLDTLTMIADRQNERSIKAFEKTGFGWTENDAGPGKVQLAKNLSRSR